MRKHIVFCFAVVLSIFASCKKTKEPVLDTNTEDTQIINYDVSSMNYNMFSAFSFDVMFDHEKYINKRIKIKGNFDSSIYEGERYFSIIIWDATGCCPAGMDFIPPENMKYPEDFPEKDTTTTVIGVLQYTEIEGQKYLTFNAEDVSWEK